VIHVLEHLRLVSFCVVEKKNRGCFNLLAYISVFILDTMALFMITYSGNRQCDKLLGTILNIACSINLFVVVSGCDCLTSDLFY